MLKKIFSLLKKKTSEKSCLNCKFFSRTHDNQCDLDFFDCLKNIKPTEKTLKLIKPYQLDNIKPEAFREGFFSQEYFCKYFKLNK